MTTVALLGKNPELLELAHASNADAFWGVSSIADTWTGPLDRLYEIHARAILRDPKYGGTGQTWPYLETCGIPVYMQELHPEIPTAEVYPLHSVRTLFHTHRGPENVENYYLTSTLDFMLAHAIYEGYSRIEVYGFDPGTDTEYLYQRPGASFWMGLAAGVGLELWLPEKCSLLKSKLYGYEGAQMVNRQQLEKQKTNLGNALQAAMAEYNRASGAVNQLQITHRDHPAIVTPDAIRKVNQDLATATAAMYRADGAVQYNKHLLDDCDMREPDYMIIDRFAQKEIA